MSWGFQIYRADGSLKIDETDFVLKPYTEGTFTATDGGGIGGYWDYWAYAGKSVFDVEISQNIDVTEWIGFANKGFTGVPYAQLPTKSVGGIKFARSYDGILPNTLVKYTIYKVVK